MALERFRHSILFDELFSTDTAVVFHVKAGVDAGDEFIPLSSQPSPGT